jgi:hypothetical protein
MKLLIGFILGMALTMPVFAVESLQSGDAYVHFDPSTTTWKAGTELVEMHLQLAQGKFLLSSLKNRLTGTEFAAGADSDEFRFLFAGMEQSGRNGDFTLKDYQVSRMPIPKASPGIEPGISLVINLEHPKFLLSLHYDIYASTPRTSMGMIRKWYQITNRTTQTQPVSEISLNHFRLKNELAPGLILYHWQGGGQFSGTNEMRAEPLEKQRSRTFYSLSGAPGFRTDDVFSGSASYHPYFVLENPKSGEGIFLGFNYLGPWSMKVWNAGEYHGRDGFLVSSHLELHTEPLEAGSTFDSPNSLVGVYQGDLDSAGEQLQDWQATFKWDLTREKYLWTTGVYNTHWDDPNHKQRIDLHTQVMWRIADLCRSTGVEIAHEDDFWFDQRGRGVWEGIDWADLVNYLKQSGILFRLWMPPQHFAPGTPPDKDHPDWALVPKVPDGITGWYGLGFCVAAQGAHDYMRKFMTDREKRYGDYYYRLDGWVQAPCWATNHDHPTGQPHLQQYRHFLQMLREVKEANPGMGLQGCNSGGEWCNWDKFELLENNQMSDGGGPDELFYLTYFWPVAKLMEFGGEDSDKLEDPAIQERQRQDVFLRRYLRQEGVLDRFMRVYHPRSEKTQDTHTFLQIANVSRTKVVIFIDTPLKEEATVYPKKLTPEAEYKVAFRFGKELKNMKGADLMRQGIRIKTENRREMILLNLQDAPGRGTDHVPPTAPSKLIKTRETFGQRTGVALRWAPGSDDKLLAEYLVYRDGKLLDHVAIGTFYFDFSKDGGLNHRYEVASVDGDGNISARAVVP